MMTVFIVASFAGFGGIGTQILNLFGYGGDMTSSAGAGAAAAVFTLGTAALTIVIGLFFQISPESYLLFGLSALLLSASIGSLYSVIQYAQTFGTEWAWAANIIVILYSVLIGGYVVSIIQWWRGNDI